MQAPVAYLVVPSLAHNKAGHSEHNGRVTAIGEALASVPGIELALRLPPAAPATAAQVTAVHSARYLAQLTAAVKKVPPRVADLSTYLRAAMHKRKALAHCNALLGLQPLNKYSFAPNKPPKLHSFSPAVAKTQQTPMNPAK